MRRIIKAAKAIVAISLVSTLAIVAAGCGDSTRNDQGTAFTFLGWFQEIDDEIVGLVFTATPLSGYPIIGGSDDPEIGAPGFLSEPFGLAGMSNNMTGQFVRVDRIHHEYFVPGASTQPPSSSVAVPTTLLPASDGLPPQSSLPGALDPDVIQPPEGAENALGNISFAAAAFIPANVREYLVLNRNQFPEPPYILVVTSTASGVTSAGNRINSNSVEFEVLIEPEVRIVPTPGTGIAGVTEDGVTGDASAEVFE